MSKRIYPGIGEELLKREGLTAVVAPREDGLRTAGGPGSCEWWYFDARFEDGSTAVVTFATKPLMPRQCGLTSLVMLTITRPTSGMRAAGAIPAPWTSCGPGRTGRSGPPCASRP